MNQPFTTLERRSTPTTQWSEEQKRAYLLQINQKENPEAVNRLRQLLAIYSADKIAKLCNEEGHLTYTNFDDPNALINRFNFLSLKQPHIITDTNRSIFDMEYYLPSIQAIHETRALVALATKGHELIKDQPTLVTADDYRAYFASFDKATFEILVRELLAIEMTKGCNGPCRAVCDGMAEGPVTATMPYEIVIELIDLHIKLGNKIFSLYDGSDLADYRDGDKTAIDIYKYLMSKNCAHSGIYTAFSLQSTTIEFIYKCVIEDLPLHVISRLVTGNNPGDFEKLMEKINEYGQAHGRALNEKERNMVKKAFDAGKKYEGTQILGNGVKEETLESNISSNILSCSHGVVFKTGVGFQARILRPPSKKYKNGELSWSISPHDNNVTIPKNAYVPMNSGPLQEKGDSFCQAPKLIHITNGTKVEPKETYEENRLRFFSLMNQIVDGAVDKHFVTDMKTKLMMIAENLRPFGGKDKDITLLPNILNFINAEIATNRDDIKNLMQIIKTGVHIFGNDEIAMDDMLIKAQRTYLYFNITLNTISEIEDQLYRVLNITAFSSQKAKIDKTILLCENLKEIITAFQRSMMMISLTV